MALTIGPSSNHATDGFRVAVDQGGSQPAGWLDDTIYVVWKNEGAAMAEPSSLGGGFGQYLKRVVVTSWGTTFVDVTGLPEQGRQYHVIAFRHYSTATPTERATVVLSNVLAEQFCTTEDAWQHSHITSLVEDWSKGLGLWTTDQWWAIPTSKWEQSSDATVGVKCSSVEGGNPIKSRFVWRHDRPWTIKAKLRQRNAQPWASLTVMTSEAEYLQIFTQGGGVAVTEVSAAGVNQQFGITTHALNTWKEFEIRGNGSGGITYYVDGVLVRTSSFSFNGPLTCWLGEVAGTSGITDHGPLTVTGDFDVWGFTCAGANRGWRYGPEGQYGIQAGTEFGGLYANGGGVTVRGSSGNMGEPGYAYTADTYAAATRRALTPTVAPASGWRLSTLRLAGRKASAGTLKCYVRKADGSLVPDGQLPGNSTGFAPTDGATLSVDLSSVTGSVYLELEVVNTGGTSRPPVWQVAAIEFSSPGTTPVVASWALPYTIRNVVGRSWALLYAVVQTIADFQLLRRLTPAGFAEFALRRRLVPVGEGGINLNMQMPPGTVVGVYRSHEWRGHLVPMRRAGSYPGPVVEEAVVTANGDVTFAGLTPGEYVAWAADFPLRRRFFVITD